MNLYNRKGITFQETNKLLESVDMLPAWNGSSKPGDLSGYSILVGRGEYGEVSLNHTVKFENQAAYLMFIRILENAVKLGYNEAGHRIDKAL